VEHLCPTAPERPRPARVYHNLPAPTYSQFIMREQPFAEVVDGLRQRSAAVLIVGLGGNGKTSLAREVAAHCLQDDHDVPHFDASVWVSDKGREGTTNLSIVLDEIARTLDYPGFTQFAHDEKQYEVEQLLRRQKVLLIVDNFETITDGALLAWLLRLPEPSKAVITTRERHRAMWGSWLIELRGMSEPEAQELIQERLRVLKMERLVSDRAQFEPLIAVTGGNPKAITMALGIIKHERQPIQQVVDDLYAARSNLFDDLFTRAWALLDDAARRVLLVMPFFVDSASGEALAATADVQGFAFDRAVERLTDLSLLDIRQDTMMTHPRYVLHPLVQAFVRSHLAEQKELEATMRERWNRYFVTFASQQFPRGSIGHSYWDSLAYRVQQPEVALEIANLLQVLKWADETNNKHTLVDLMLLMAHSLTHYSLFYERLFYARKAARAAHELQKYADESLLCIDALGWVLTETCHLTEAEAEIRQGLALTEYFMNEASQVNDITALGNAFLAKIFLEKQDLPQAIQHIETARSLDSQHVIYRRVLEIAGDIEQKKDNYQQAIQIYLQANQITRHYDPGNDMIDVRLGFAYLANGELAKAESVFEKLLVFRHEKSRDEIAKTTYGLACLAEQRNELDKARTLAEEALSELVRLRIEHKSIQEIETFLSKIEATQSGQ
jgi:tetratricopeptide (TPR) repeat protein